MFYFETQRKRDENDKIVVKRKLEMEGLESNLDKRKEGKKRREKDEKTESKDGGKERKKKKQERKLRLVHE